MRRRWLEGIHSIAITGATAWNFSPVAPDRPTWYEEKRTYGSTVRYRTGALQSSFPLTPNVASS